jgi:hypothetical protein
MKKYCFEALHQEQSTYLTAAGGGIAGIYQGDRQNRVLIDTSDNWLLYCNKSETSIAYNTKKSGQL